MRLNDFIYERTELSKSARDRILEAFDDFKTSLDGLEKLVIGDGERVSNKDVNQYISIILAPRLEELRKNINKNLK